MAYRNEGGAVIDRTSVGDWNAPAAVPSLVPALPRDFGRNNSAGPGPNPKLSSCPEIDCVRHLLPPDILDAAARRADEIGVRAERVLITWGFISEETYVSALVASLGIPFEPLFNTPREHCPLTDDQIIEAANTGMLRLADGIGDKIVVAPRLVDSRRMVELAMSGHEMAQRIRLTSAARLQAFVTRHGKRNIERRAVDDLRVKHPELSAGVSRSRRLIISGYALLLFLVAVAFPDASMMAIEVLFGVVFLAWTGLRLLGLLSERFLRRRPKQFFDDGLPTYSIIVALYREAATAGSLVASLRELNYPLEKLDIKFVLEADDHETRKALARLQLGPPFEIVIAPSRGPRTKPKALNAVLPFVRGKFVAVFDAEDRPERDQLRLAVEAFTESDQRLACVQARLTIDNTADSWRVFTAEYAGLFDVFLPGLAAWRLPLPLGGSSNHFRTDVLRQIGAWDPYNVTEDADLGMRLARFGYRTAVIASTTYEEAPVRLGPWLRQRTRWFKGWMQTWLVHMRAPRRLATDLEGLSGFAVFQLVVGGTVLSALIHAVFAAQLAIGFVTVSVDDERARLFLGVYATMLMLGYGASATIGVIGLSRRRLLGCAWALLLMPVYWLLLSLAAWRALFQIVRAPYLWEKTEHGLARTSRLARRI